MVYETMYDSVVNSPNTKLSSAIGTTETTLYFDDVGVFPDAPNIATLGYDTESPETVLYTGVNTTDNSLTGVTRGFDGGASSWGVDTLSARVFTSYDYSMLQNNIDWLKNNYLPLDGSLNITGDINLNGNRVINTQAITTNNASFPIQTEGSGSSYISLYDNANSQSILEAHEGGNVQIPSGNLDVNGALTLNLGGGIPIEIQEYGSFRAYLNYNYGNDKFELHTADSAGNNVKRLVIQGEQDATRVGIGTEFPTEVLDIDGDIRVRGSGDTIGGTNLSNAFIRVGNDLGIDSNEIIFKNMTGHLGTGDANDLNIKTNNINRVRVASNGNVGIGTESPSGKLDINGRTSFRDGADFGNGDSGNPDKGVITWNTDGFIIRSQSGEKLNFGTDGYNYNMVMDTAGQVGIGETSPYSLLHIKKNSVSNAHYNTVAGVIYENDEGRVQIIAEDGGNAGALLQLTNAPSSGDNKHWHLHHFATGSDNRFGISYETSSSSDNLWNGTEYFTVATNGKVGIGNTSPSSKLDVNGDIHSSSGIYGNYFEPNSDADDSYSTLRVYSNPDYAIGMKSSEDYGDLEDTWAMTFTMSQHPDNRGWLWRDSDDSKSDGAMSLTQHGKLYVKDTVSNKKQVIRDSSDNDKFQIEYDEDSKCLAFNFVG